MDAHPDGHAGDDPVAHDIETRNPDSDDPYEPGGDCSSSHMHCIWTCVYCGGGVEAL